MSPFQTRTGGRRRGAAFRALLVSASVLVLAGVASAQETELRGSVSESAILADQQRKADELAQAAQQEQAERASAADQGVPATPAYQPFSSGATPDAPTDTTGSLFDSPTANDDNFATDQPPLPRYKPKTATQTDDQKTSSVDGKAGAKPTGEEAAQDGAAQADTDTNVRAPTVDSADKISLDPGAERTGAIETRDTDPEDDPYAPLGIKMGSFTLRPSVEQGVTATTNANSSSGGEPAVLSETTLRLNAISDWATNSASIDGYGIVRKTISGDEVSDARGRIEGTLNLDLDNEWRAIAKAGYEAGPESASSPVEIVGTASQPLKQTLDGSLAIQKDIGKARLGLTGAVEREIYGDAKLSAGGTLSQKDRNSTLYTATLRGGYEISPALTPFAEIEVGRRVYDQRTDNSGFAYERSSSRLGLRGGVELDMGEKLAGEFSAGWLREAIDDDRLPAISGATVAADLKWSPERGTVIGLNGATTVEGTTTAGESGSVLYSGRLALDREIRANLTANATLGADWRDYVGNDGHDQILSAEAGLTWWLNRYAGLTTRVRTEKLTSNLPGRDYTANSIFLGLKLQR